MAAQTICMRDGLMEQKRQQTARKEQKEAEIDNNSAPSPGKARPAGLFMSVIGLQTENSLQLTR
jgi:hypothetical protein